MVAEEQTSQRAQDRLDVLLHEAGFVGDVVWDAAPLQHHGVVIPVHDRLQQSFGGLEGVFPEHVRCAFKELCDALFVAEKATPLVLQRGGEHRSQAEG